MPHAIFFFIEFLLAIFDNLTPKGILENQQNAGVERLTLVCFTVTNPI